MGTLPDDPDPYNMNTKPKPKPGPLPPNVDGPFMEGLRTMGRNSANALTFGYGDTLGAHARNLFGYGSDNTPESVKAETTRLSAKHPGFAFAGDVLGSVPRDAAIAAGIVASGGSMAPLAAGAGGGARALNAARRGAQWLGGPGMGQTAALGAATGGVSGGAELATKGQRGEITDDSLGTDIAQAALSPIVGGTVGAVGGGLLSRTGTGRAAGITPRPLPPEVIQGVKGAVATGEQHGLTGAGALDLGQALNYAAKADPTEGLLAARSYVGPQVEKIMRGAGSTMESGVGPARELQSATREKAGGFFKKVLPMAEDEADVAARTMRTKMGDTPTPRGNMPPGVENIRKLIVEGERIGVPRGQNPRHAKASSAYDEATQAAQAGRTTRAELDQALDAWAKNDPTIARHADTQKTRGILDDLYTSMTPIAAAKGPPVLPPGRAQNMLGEGLNIAKRAWNQPGPTRAAADRLAQAVPAAEAAGRITTPQFVNNTITPAFLDTIVGNLLSLKERQKAGAR